MTLDIITHDLLKGIQHGFFTRAGGASSGIFKGLNCGFGSSDQHDIVAINRGRVAAALDVAPLALVGVHQIHSADVVTVTDATAERPKADALVTATPGVAISVLTADCQPVLFADRDAGVIGAAHAGWQGALNGVLDATVDAMVTLGATREAIVAVIGPSISQRAYEVGTDFAERFIDMDAHNARFFANGKAGKMQFDLPAFGLSRLRAAGIKDAAWTRHCTYSDPDRFYSYRRSTHKKEADYGRLIAAIRL
ncbi:peptidoglycan editing factor PgeF [Yoonia sp. MH D7]